MDIPEPKRQKIFHEEPQSESESEENFSDEEVEDWQMDIDDMFVWIRKYLFLLDNQPMLLTLDQAISYATIFIEFWQVEEGEHWLDVYLDLIGVPSFTDIDKMVQDDALIITRRNHIMNFFVLMGEIICAHEHEQIKKLGAQIYRIFITVYEIFESIFSITRAAKNHQEQMINATAARVAAVYFNQFRELSPDMKKEQSSHAQFIAFVLRHCARRSLTRQKNDKANLYKAIYVGNQNTYAYQKDCKIVDFIYNISSKDTSVDGFFMATKTTSSIDYASKYIEQMDNTFELPIIQRDRSTFSFKNGIYFAKHDMFFPYGNGMYIIVTSSIIYI